MKSLLKSLGYTAIVLYLFFAFVLMDANPYTWGMAARGWYVGVIAFITLVINWDPTK